MVSLGDQDLWSQQVGEVGLMFVKLLNCIWNSSASLLCAVSWKVLSGLGQGSDLPL